jgi:hypothetical protein
MEQKRCPYTGMESMNSIATLSELIRRRPQGTTWEKGRRWLLFLLFGLYTAIALLWLILGLTPILIGASAPLKAFVLDLQLPLPAWGELQRQIYFASFTLESPSAVVVQYLFSVANIALGITLVGLRPQDLVAWLLALGLIGTGAIFNMQSHVLIDRSAHPWLNAIHEVLHFTSGGAYSFALLLFPTGSLPPSPFPHLRLPQWFDWALRIALVLFIIFFGWGMLGELHGEPVTFVVFFGVLVPVIGGIAQLFRYRRALSGMVRFRQILLYKFLAHPLSICRSEWVK